MRICPTCKQEKPVSGFGRLSRSKDGLNPYCKACNSESSKRHWHANVDRVKAAQRERGRKSREVARAKLLEAQATPEAIALREERAQAIKRAKYDRANARKRERYKQNPEKYLESSRRSKKARADSILAYRRAIYPIQRQSPAHVLNTRMRSRMNMALKQVGLSKGGASWQDLVGYSSADLHTHLERQFSKGMSWDNRQRWHIDHIIPVASFKIEAAGDAEFRRAWALSNLRPIWAEENKRKGARIESLL